MAAAGARGLGRGLQEPLPPGHAHEDARREGRRRARHRGVRRLHHRPRRPRGAAAPRRAALRRGRPARSADRPLRPRQRLRRSAAPLPARRGVRHGRAHAPRAGLPRAGRGHQRRPLRHARRAPALRRAHLRAPSHHRGRRRPPAGAQRRALSQAARGDGAALLGSSRRAPGDRGARRASRVHDGRSRLPLPGLSGAGRRQRDVVPAPHRRGRRPRSLPALSREGAPPDRPRARSDRAARSRRLLPDRVGHRQLLPPARHPGAGPRLGRQQRRLLQPRHHRHRPDQDGAALRAVPVGRARRVARHRPRPAERRPARAGHPARLREVRPARRGHDRQRHHLPRQERRARGGEGARARRGADRSPRQGDAQLRVHRPQRDARPQHGGGRHRARRAAGADVRRICGGRSRTCRATSGSTRAGWWCARASSIPWCRSSRPACPAASSSSGTRTTAPTWAS